MKSKTSKKQRNTSKKLIAMGVEDFEMKYVAEIEMLTERILDTKPELTEHNYEEVYDDAYEEAVWALAQEKHIEIE
jgi:hypothetical protein